MLGLGAEHFEKARTATRGKDSTIPEDRLLPSAAVSTFGLIVVILYCVAKLRSPDHGEACKEVLGHWFRRFVSKDFAFRLVLNTNTRVNFATREVAPSGLEALVCCRGGALEFGEVIHKPEGAALNALVYDLGSSPSLEVMASLAKQLELSAWLLAQLLFATGLAMESDYDDCSRSSASPVECGFGPGRFLGAWLIGRVAVSCYTPNLIPNYPQLGRRSCVRRGSRNCRCAGSNPWSWDELLDGSSCLSRGACDASVVPTPKLAQWAETHLEKQCCAIPVCLRVLGFACLVVAAGRRDGS